MENAMIHQTDAPCGSWKSSVTSEMISEGSISFQELCVEGNDIYWLESRPKEQGRVALVHQRSGKEPRDLIPSISIRTRVHEYGGGSFTVHNGLIYFIDSKDQSLYRVRPEGKPEPLTEAGNRRFADFAVAPNEKFLFCVCEEHCENGQVINSLVSIGLDGEKRVTTIASGHDFYSSPRISPDGSFLAWITWDHPNMPWDATQLWSARINDHGLLEEIILVAGRTEESVCQPQWSEKGILHFISDRNGWWNLYRWAGHEIDPLCPMKAEFSLPQWVFRRDSYVFVPGEDRILCSYCEKGIDHLGILYLGEKRMEPLDLPYTVAKNLCLGQNNLFFFGASPLLPLSLVRLDLSSKKSEILRQSFYIELDKESVSIPEEISYASLNNQEGYAFFYPPQNPHFKIPAGELPPLIVKCHGGPTAHAQTALSLETQYWTTRGVGVLDVNYGGSSGYGRSYRKRLEGTWGIVDVQDCINAALHLANTGRADRGRLLIKGGSAGGYTVLCALTFHDVFAAGTSLYGVSDLELLVKDTHKFESHYLDRLIGPYPQQKELYIKRGPIHHIETLNRPVLLLQGSDDPVVPLNQAVSIFRALKKKGTPVALIVFDKEQHGFRMAANIKRALDAELYFYSKILKFSLPDQIEPVTIENIR
jgi:dipeptidyl aminopeptidase/acylaminoacyl peptidase